MNRLTKSLITVSLFLLCSCDNSIVKEPIDNNGNPHIVVIGSEIEGIYLARAAVDEGLSVLVLDPREKVGGQLIQGEMQFLDEPVDDKNKTLLQGRVKELFNSYKKGDIRKASEFESYYNNLTKGIKIETGIKIDKIEKKYDSKSGKQKIESITFQKQDGTKSSLKSNYWVENTDFASLVSQLDIETIPGVETVFGGPRDYMAASIMMKFRNVDWPKFQNEVNLLSKQEREKKYGSMTTVTDKFTWGFGNVGANYKPTRKEVFLRGLNTINQRDGEVLINALLLYNVDPSKQESVEEALKLGRSETERILPHLQKELPGWEKAEINGFPNYLYVRDFTRYQTEYVLQASDIMSGKMFWDNVSIAGYPIDLQGTINRTWGQHSGDPDKYGMPLRSFIPKGYSNVILAGKNVGASAVAYGSARIQPNTSLAGEVIGIILGSLKGKEGLTDLNEKDMKEIHESLKRKYDIVLSGVESNDKIKKLTEEERKQLDIGKLTLP
ncbi:FAD-dependent oxidoreductase [Paenibacillus sp. NPDC056579]|uniref:FAD-dependent oxidoreductase n=1 Tax=Paenibacillus sp. NPDC056579 TaxID=3345871 RepID=UPI00368C4021